MVTKSPELKMRILLRWSATPRDALSDDATTALSQAIRRQVTTVIDSSSRAMKFKHLLEEEGYDLRLPYELLCQYGR